VIKKVFGLSVIVILFFCQPVSSFPGTLWKFDITAEPLKASFGPGTLIYLDSQGTGWGPIKTKFKKASELGLPPLPGGDAQVMGFPETTPDEGYSIKPNSLPNGVFKDQGLISNYTLIMDILWPLSSDGIYRSLYQTDLSNSGDGEIYVKNQSNGGIGINTHYHGLIIPDRWHRVALVVQAASGTGGEGQIHKYIDGQFVGGQTPYAPSGINRWAIRSLFHLFTDGNQQTAQGYVSSIYFDDRMMTEEEVRALGGPHSGGANTPGKSPDPLPKASKRVKIIAHRGNSCCSPENTLVSIDEAFKNGADLVEVDIRLSSDGVAVLMHDEKVDRTTNGKGLVSDMTVVQLKQLDAGSWWGPQFKGEAVPTLAEALLMAKRRGRLLLDIKTSEMAEPIAKALKDSGVTVNAIWPWRGASKSNARALKEKIPQIQILWGEPESWDSESLKKLKELGVVGLELNYESLKEEFIESAKTHGLFVLTYTILDPQTMLEAIQMGVYGMETDFPGILNRIMP